MNWSTDTPWFDVALVNIIFALGNIWMGHFEVHTPRWRRTLKVVIFTGIILVISATVGRVWSFALLGVLTLAVLYVHAIWLPSKGINGWTAEPRDQYYKLRKWKQKA